MPGHSNTHRHSLADMKTGSSPTCRMVSPVSCGARLSSCSPDRERLPSDHIPRRSATQSNTHTHIHTSQALPQCQQTQSSPMASAVSLASPVISFTLTPLSLSRRMAISTPWRGGSHIAISPTNTRRLRSTPLAIAITVTV